MTTRSMADSYLYHISKGHKIEEIASFYSVNTSRITPIEHNSNLDYLVSVRCACEKDNKSNNAYYLYDSVYKRKPGESVGYISEEYYSGQVWYVSGEDEEQLTVHLVCGCLENETREVVTYTIQAQDTLIGISGLLSAKENEVENLNKVLTKDPNYVDIGWVLFVPQEKNKIRASKKWRMKTWKIIIFIVLPVLVMVAFLVLYLHRKRARKMKKDESKTIRRKINVGKTTLEAAIKKMRSNKSKEFFAELKVLCRIHHNNVVQLLGYASGDNHLYLVYEYVPNGTFGDHLQDPLLKGHQPLSWTARANIALDAARGIEYIHDHTKARYVHRDIKTSNILLDLGLKAKVADFGLTKLIERANEDVLAELITGQHALARDKQEPNKLKTLVSVIRAIFQDQDSAAALEAQVDSKLKGSYPIEEMFKCLSEDPANRPEMCDDVVTILGQIVMASIEWEASLGGSSQVFSGLFDGR
ncbi:hypothetical protein L1987_80109 [Smallanthus sonchifolius]|uniref:Uncharacterized protein n=1 Tax=Smallanthus sonchifolius TaxID=185202 RepID=A0ACB8YMU1_9ASTR|nr:hypothetical protein L1987_80109 [Smallanthus sonchifolius]